MSDDSAPTPDPPPPATPPQPTSEPPAPSPFTAAGSPQPPAYPVRFEVAYQERLSRLSTFFRLILMIPLAIFVSIIGGTSDVNSFASDEGRDFVFVSVGALGSFILAHWIVVFLRLRPAVGYSTRS